MIRLESIVMVSKIIRVPKKNSAFVYAILESLEGMASYSTLDKSVGKNFRDLQLFIPEAFVGDINFVLESLRKEFPILELDPE